MSSARSMSNKYGKKLADTAKKSATDAIKTASKRTIQKNAEGTGDLIGNKIANKITSISKNSVKKLPIDDEDMEITTHKKDTYRQKKDDKLLMNQVSTQKLLNVLKLLKLVNV